MIFRTSQSIKRQRVSEGEGDSQSLPVPDQQEQHENKEQEEDKEPATQKKRDAKNGKFHFSQFYLQFKKEWIKLA